MLAICLLGSLMLTAQTYTFDGAGTAIPDGDQVDVTITVAGTDEDVIGDEFQPTLFVDISHTWIGDIELTLTSPEGTSLLVTRGLLGNSNDVMMGTWSDQGIGFAMTGDDVDITGSYMAEGGTFVDAFGGENPNGVWTMTITDQNDFDTGTFDGGTLTFAAPVDPLATDMQEINVAGTGNINLTLNDECQGLVIPEMVLTGDFDVDGDDFVIGSEFFTVTVMDNNPTNGPIVDGCGTFNYRIDANAPEFEITSGFTGDFDPAGGNITITAGEFTTATFSADQQTLVLTSQAEVTEPQFFMPTDNVSAAVQFVEAGIVSFSFVADILGTNGFNDIALVDFEGNTLFELPAGGSPFGGASEKGDGIVSGLAVSAGDVLTFDLIGDNEMSDEASVFTITDFEFVVLPLEVPVEIIGFSTTWGTVNAEDKTAPSIDGTPDDIDLLCVDLDGNNVSTLSVSVSHCYRVNAQTGNIVPGTMASALRALLLARTASPVVPVFTDGCSQELEVCVSDDVVYGADAACDDVVITRTFVATEVSTCVSASGEGNPSVSTSYTITFDSPTLDDLDEDSFDAVVEIESCGADASVRPAPSAADYPTLVVG
ncbi:MAG: subtilisin-like proprotein convertase family protein, partial [Neolewinella sp.]